MSTENAMYVIMALHGLAYGMLLFMIASGLTMIFGMMGLLNLAHAFFFVLAASIGSMFYWVAANFWISLLLAPVLVGMAGMLFERLFFKKQEDGILGYLGQILPTMGVALLIMIIVRLVQSSYGVGIPTILMPPSLSGWVIIAGFEYPVYRLFVIALSFVILAVFALILFKSRLGLIVRAAVSDAEMVDALGINTSLIYTLAFGIGSWMAGVAGVAATPLYYSTFGLLRTFTIESFVVVIVGGLGSLPGAFIASLVIGQLQTYGTVFFPTLAPALMFFFMVLVLAFRPKGIFGKRS